jgi:ribosomal protein L40E
MTGHYLNSAGVFPHKQTPAISTLHMMPSESEQSLVFAAEADEKQLCVGCMAPNETSAHFCAKCGAPLSSYAATGPLEHVFAEGHLYRQAADRPASLIVVLGIWMIFGVMALAGVTLILLSGGMGIQERVLGAFILVISVLLIWKTTHNYCARKKADGRQQGQSSPDGLDRP